MGKLFPGLMEIIVYNGKNFFKPFPVINLHNFATDCFFSPDDGMAAAARRKVRALYYYNRPSGTALISSDFRYRPLLPGSARTAPAGPRRRIIAGAGKERRKLHALRSRGFLRPIYLTQAAVSVTPEEKKSVKNGRYLANSPDRVKEIVRRKNP